jgi:hypothetical protein
VLCDDVRFPEALHEWEKGPTLAWRQAESHGIIKAGSAENGLAWGQFLPQVIYVKQEIVIKEEQAEGYSAEELAADVDEPQALSQYLAEELAADLDAEYVNTMAEKKASLNTNSVLADDGCCATQATQEEMVSEVNASLVGVQSVHSYIGVRSFLYVLRFQTSGYNIYYIYIYMCLSLYIYIYTYINSFLVCKMFYSVRGLLAPRLQKARTVTLMYGLVR